jgi:hypothetical protein
MSYFNCSLSLQDDHEIVVDLISRRVREYGGTVGPIEFPAAA